MARSKVTVGKWPTFVLRGLATVGALITPNAQSSAETVDYRSTTPRTEMTFRVETPIEESARLAVIAYVRQDYPHTVLPNETASPIYAAGDITADSPAQFRAFVTSHHITKANVILDSLGGSPAAAMALGAEISRYGFDTKVDDGFDSTQPHAQTYPACMGACVFAFLGGVRRYYLDSHRISVFGFGAANAGIPQATIDDYVAQRGVDTVELSRVVSSTKTPTSWLTWDQSEKTGIANNGALPTTAGIEQEKGLSLLALKQERIGKTVIVDLFCRPGGPLIMVMALVGDPAKTAEYLNALTSAYVEFGPRDYALVEHGKDAASGMNPGGISLSRIVPPEIGARLLTAGRMGIWLQNGTAYRWGGEIDLRFVRAQLAGYLARCGANTAVAQGAASPTPRTVPMGNGNDLIIAIHRWSPTDRKLALLDRATIKRVGDSVTAMSYLVTRTGGADAFSISADRYDCSQHVGWSSIVHIDRDGGTLGSTKIEWKAGDEAIERIGKLACDPSLIEEKNVVGDYEPIATLRQFSDSAVDEQP